MSKKSFKIKLLINSEVKVGDTVRLFDGSSLSVVGDDSREVFIVFSYPGLTQRHELLKYLDAKVTRVGVQDRVSQGANSLYLQDIVIKIGTTEFRTASQLVTKVR